MWKLIAGFALVFVAGGVLGGFVGAAGVRHWYAAGPHHGMASDRMKERLRNQLQLTPEQVTKITPILDKAGGQLEDIRRDTGQRVHRVLSESHKEIAPLLTDEQRQKFRRIQERHRQWQSHMHHHPPAGGAGESDDPPPPDETPQTL
jgi:Spy/CpxP family protein refolding chaperone